MIASVLHDCFLGKRSKSLEFTDFAHSVREVSVTLLYVIFGRDFKEFCAVPQIFLDIFQEILTRFFFTFRSSVGRSGELLADRP